MIPKFRAWDKKHKQMIRVISLNWYEHILDYNVVGLFPNTESVARFWDETIVMQSTGLKDKNGIEIYEGDVVNVTQYFGGHSFGQLPHVVKVSEYSNVLVLDALSKQNYVEEYTLYFSRLKDYEVIGNIYENPELLEAHT